MALSLGGKCITNTVNIENLFENFFPGVTDLFRILHFP